MKTLDNLKLKAFRAPKRAGSYRVAPLKLRPRRCSSDFSYGLERWILGSRYARSCV